MIIVCVLFFLQDIETYNYVEDFVLDITMVLNVVYLPNGILLDTKIISEYRIEVIFSFSLLVFYQGCNFSSTFRKG